MVTLDDASALKAQRALGVSSVQPRIAKAGSDSTAGCFAAPYQGLSPVRGNSHAGFSGGRVTATSPGYPTCDTKSHAYLSGSMIRCSATGTLPSRALGVTLGCEALGTR